MKKIWVITRREFMMTVTRKAYILSVIGVPIFFVAIGGIAGFSVSRLESSLSQRESALGVIDQARVIDPKLFGTSFQEDASAEIERILGKRTYLIKSYDSLETGLRDLQEGELRALYVVESDYVASGGVVLYTRKGGIFSKAGMPGRNELNKLLRASLLQDQIGSETLDRVLNPSELKEFSVMEDGSISAPSSELEEVGTFLFPLSVAFLMTFAVFLSAGYLLQTTVEEKENRVIEIVLSSVKPEQLLWGKILGLGGAALLQVVIYLALVGTVGISFIAFVDFSAGNLLISLFYCVLGYLLFASLLATTGIIGGTLRESSQLSSIWTLTAMIPFMLMSILLEAPNGTVARVLSFIPLTSPVTMIIRLSITTVPVLDTVLSITILMGAIYLAVLGASKIFRAASLMYGKRPSVSEIFRWLRQA